MGFRGSEVQRFTGSELPDKILIWQINMPTENPHLVIPAKAGIQYLQARIWIPALRYAAAGMTNLLARLIILVFLLCDRR